MRFLKLLLFPIVFPIYSLFFFLSATCKAIPPFFKWMKKLPEFFCFIATLAGGYFIYYDYNHDNMIGLKTAATNELIIKCLYVMAGAAIILVSGILICKLIWYLISKFLLLLSYIEKAFEAIFFFFHRFYKTTIYDLINSKYAFSDNNVYQLKDIDGSKYKVVDIDNKKYIYPLLLEYTKTEIEE